MHREGPGGAAGDGGGPCVSPGKGGPSASGVCVRGWRGQHGDSGVPRVSPAVWRSPLAPPGGQQEEPPGVWGLSPWLRGTDPSSHAGGMHRAPLTAWGASWGGDRTWEPLHISGHLWLLCSTPQMHPPPEMPTPSGTATKPCPRHPTERAQHHLHGWDFPRCVFFFFLTCKAPKPPGSGTPRPNQRGGGCLAPHLQLKAILLCTHGLHPSQNGLAVAEGSRAEQLHPRSTLILSSKWPGRAASVFPSPGRAVMLSHFPLPLSPASRAICRTDFRRGLQSFPAGGC